MKPRATRSRAGLAAVLFVIAATCAAQDLPDPGRRLPQREIDFGPEKKDKPAAKDSRKRDEQVCERARVNRQLACGPPLSARERSFGCTEAIVIQNQSC